MMLMTFLNISFVGLFACVALGSASAFVIFFKNQVLSVFSLILVFLIGSVIILILGADFLAFTYVIVYMGAVAVLFLFVVMMLQIKNTVNPVWTIYSPLSGLIFIIFFFVLFFSFNFFNNNSFLLFDWFNSVNFQSNIILLGQLIYTYFFIYFIFSSLILLVSLVGAILLTLPNVSNSMPISLFSLVDRFLKTNFFVNLKKNKYFFLSASVGSVDSDFLGYIVPISVGLLYGGMFGGWVYMLHWQYQVKKLENLAEKRAADRQLFFDSLGLDILKDPELLSRFTYPKVLINKLKINRSWRKYDLDVYRSLTDEYREPLFTAFTKYYSNSRMWWYSPDQIKIRYLPVPNFEVYPVSAEFISKAFADYQKAGTFRYLSRFKDSREILAKYLESTDRVQSFNWYQKILYYFRTPLQYLRDFFGLEVRGEYRLHIFNLFSNMEEMTKQALLTKGLLSNAYNNGHYGVCNFLYPRDKEIVALYKSAMTDVYWFKVSCITMVCGVVIIGLAAGFMYFEDSFSSDSSQVNVVDTASNLDCTDTVETVKHMFKNSNIEHYLINYSPFSGTSSDFKEIIKHFKPLVNPCIPNNFPRIPIPSSIPTPSFVPFDIQNPGGLSFILVEFVSSNLTSVVSFSFEILKHFF